MISKLKKTNDLVGIVSHGILSLILPVVLFVLTNNFNLYLLAFAVVAISKWRVFMVSPRFWLDNIKANGVDFIFGFSIVAASYLVGKGGAVTEIPSSNTIFYWRLAIIIFYAFWLLVIKHFNHKLGILLQSFCSLILGIIVAFWSLIVPLAFNQQLAAVILVLVITSCSYHIRLSYQDAQEGKYVSFMWFIMVSFLLPFIFMWVKSLTILNGPVLTSSGLIISIIFINFELSYYLTKKSKANSIIILNQVATLLGIAGISLWLAWAW